MKIDYNVSANLDAAQIFALLKEVVEKKTGKMLCDIYWKTDVEGNPKCELVFRNETVELKE